MFSLSSSQTDAFAIARVDDITDPVIGPLPPLPLSPSSPVSGPLSGALPVHDRDLEAGGAGSRTQPNALQINAFTAASEPTLFPQQGLPHSALFGPFAANGAKDHSVYPFQSTPSVSYHDDLTGVSSTEALLNHPASLPTPPSINGPIPIPANIPTTISPLQSLQNTQSYSAISGYGLMNANTAVAWATGNTSLPQQVDLGGVNIGNDMVNAPDAWAQGITGQDITVAVIDSGVDVFHPDLNDNIWVNSGEIFGDGIDNDLNGYVDDIMGWNFGSNNYDVLDYHGHGTHVAGTVAAEANGVGTTGVAPGAKIMPIKIGDVGLDNRFLNAGNLAQAIRYAVDNGADVINMSLSWTPSFELLEAFAYAASQNVITVTAAGNNGMIAPSTPATFSTLYGLTVGAVDYGATMASFSNWAGRNSQMNYVIAPGVSVYSTRPTNLDLDGYGLSNGTSMAAPHVAGVVALMLSANPDLTHDQVRSIATQSATYLGDNRGGTNPTNPFFPQAAPFSAHWS